MNADVACRPDAPVAAPARTAQRLVSLDVFRGATIAAMMLVNNPGDWGAVYPPLLHAEWNGWTFTDLVFPFFLWIVGVAIPLSTARRLEQGQGRSVLLRHALRRAAILFALGLFLNVFNYLIDGSLWRLGLAAWWHNLATTVRLPGVLQRIAVCYLAATLVYLWTTRAERKGPPAEAAGRVLPHISAAVRMQLAVLALLLGVYWVFMAAWPVPGFGRGVLEPQGNFSQYLDNLVLNGPTLGTHVWKASKTWDPEGLFSTLPAMASCLFGVLAGQLLRSKLSPESRTAWLFTGGVLLLLAGECLSPWLPINKSIWTSSYAVFMAGMATVCFAVCYWLVDVQGWRRGTKPFAVYGMNAIAVFVLAGVLGRLSLELKVAPSAGDPVALKTFLYARFFAPFAHPETAPFFGFLASPKNASLLWALTYVLGLYVVAYVMYRRKWFLKV